MTFSALVLFAAVYCAAVATPGPGVAALVARVLGQGLKGVAPFIAGYFVGDMIWLTFAATGLAVVAKTFAGVFVAIKFAGAAYLLYLAWRMATAPAAVEAAPTPATRGWRAFLASLSLTLGNPKVMVFFLSIMPLVVDLTDADRVCARRTCRRLRDRDLLDARALRIRRKPGAGSSPLDPGDAVRQSRRRRTHGRSRGRGRHEVRPCRISSRLAKRWSSSTSRRTAPRSSRGSAATPRTP